MVSILILLDYLFLLYSIGYNRNIEIESLNPYFIGLPILMIISKIEGVDWRQCLNPYFIGLPILIFY